MDGRFVGDVTACRPEWPIGNAWVVFDDNKVWAACWNGGWGWYGRFAVVSPTVGQSGRSGTPGSFLMTTMCGLRVGMGLRVAWPFCRDVTECWPEWPIGNAWVVLWVACWNGG